MAFISYEFLAFLAAFFLLYFCVPKRLQWPVLLVASYGFYLLADGGAAAYLLVATAAAWGAALLLERLKAAPQRRAVLAAGLVLLFGLLAVLKYSGFFMGIVNGIAGRQALRPLSLLLPLGISFYVLQAAGYLIDVYRGKYAAARNPAKFALFMGFFPQLVQGPISRYDALAHQLTAHHRFSYTGFTQGLQLVLWGYCKKLVIADRAALFVNHVLADGQAYAGLPVAVTILLYTLQLYADFSGGIDIARGVAACCGIRLAENFKRPYLATSVSEYWQRWHITLGTWMRDYLLYPLALSRPFVGLGRWARGRLGRRWGKVLPTALAMWVVFLAVGLWHGPAWKYVLFGVYNGVLILAGILLAPGIAAWNAKHRLVRTDTRRWRVLKRLWVLVLMAFSKNLVMPGTAADAFARLGRLFSAFNPGALVDGTLYGMGLDKPNLWLLLAFSLLFFAVSLAQERGVRIRETIARQNIFLRWLVYLGAVFAVLIFGVYGFGYTSDSFIYQGF